jgi:hypothetical protein
MKNQSKRKTQGSARPAQAGASFGGLQRQSEVVEFNPDYTYVKRDLRRIAVLAGSIFAVLIALSFFIQ